MTLQSGKAPLSFTWNDTSRPVHQNRQVLRAADLTLEQSAQDAMLARARRYLHGWGVVEGFVPDVAEGQVLTIGPGYGVTPTGAELWLPAPAVLEGAAEAAWACCGPDPAGCDAVEATEVAVRREAVASATVTAWLIARPASRFAEPRAGVPKDCAHPANTLLPSRSCGGVDFAILCELPPTHQPPAPDCAMLLPFACGTANSAPEPLPWEVPAGTDDDFLVIALLVAAGGRLSADPWPRRQLWPVALIQDWITACLCPRLTRPTKPVPPPTEPNKPGTPPRGPVNPDPRETLVGPGLISSAPW